VYRLYCSLPILCTGCACQLIIKDNDDDDYDDDDDGFLVGRHHKIMGSASLHIFMQPLKLANSNSLDILTSGRINLKALQKNKWCGSRLGEHHNFCDPHIHRIRYDSI